MLLENFPSVQIILEEEDNKFVNDKKITYLANWLNNFDKWYKKETGINNNQNLHFFYHRELFISGFNLLANMSAIECLLSSCSQLGFLLCLRINLEECYKFSAQLEKLTNEFRPSYLIIRANISAQKYPPNFIISLIEKLASKKINLSFIGPVSFWLDAGVSRSQILGENVYEIMPEISEFKRKYWRDYNPCAKKFMFVINYDGLIYPCQSLVGIENCSIGTIEQPLSTVWETMKQHWLNIEKLARQGPNLTILNTSDNLNFENICEAHRYSILNNIKG